MRAAELAQAVAGLHLWPRDGRGSGSGGQHFSLQPGQQGSFREYRPYLPGDPLRRLDWRAFAKTEKYFVRLHHDEQPQPLTLLLDASGSMGFGSALSGSKLQVAARLALCIAWLALRQGDAVGLQLAAADAPQGGAPSHHAGAWAALQATLARLQPGGRAQLSAAVTRLLAQRSSSGLVVVLSDLLDDDAGLLPALAALQKRGHVVRAVQVLDPQELDLSLEGPGVLQDMEGDASLFVDPLRHRGRYRQALQALLDDRRRALHSCGIPLTLARTDQPLRELLRQLLA